MYGLGVRVGGEGEGSQRNTVAMTFMCACVIKTTKTCRDKKMQLVLKVTLLSRLIKTIFIFHFITEKGGGGVVVKIGEHL